MKYIEKHKTLISVIKRRTRIPVLSMVSVTDGIASSTDMDFMVSVPSSLDNGLYYKDGIPVGLYIKSDVDQNDFPMMDVSGDLECEVVLDAQTLSGIEWVSNAVSKEATRYYLCGVCFDGSDGNYIVATNGHILNCFSIDQKIIGRHILPSKAVKLISQLAKEMKANAVTIRFYKGNRFSASVAGAKICGKLIDGTYLDWQRIVPEDYNPAGKFSVGDFKRIMPQVLALSKINKQKTPALKIEKGKVFLSDDNVKSGISWDTTLDVKKIGFNANYLIKLCDGDAFYKDHHSPLPIKGDQYKNQISVIMPMRVY